MKEVILKCKELETLNIANMPMKKPNAVLIANALKEVIKGGSKLRELYWGDGMNNCTSVAKQFLKDVSQIQGCSL